MIITTLIGIQTACVATATFFIGYKIINESLKNKIRLTMVHKEGKFKHYRVGGK